MAATDESAVLVLGAGQMGAGIAQVCICAGYEATLVDVAPEVLRRAEDGIRQRLARDVSKGRRTEADSEAALGRLRLATDPEAARRAHLVIEAIVEDPAAKLAAWRRLDELAAPGALLASNTSSISITRLAAATRRPERFLGIHFFNPVPVMPLVELIRGLGTSDATFDEAREVVRRLGKTAVAARDMPGFVANRMLMPLINEAAYELMEGVASAEDIDAAARLGLGHPMGPLRLADLIGLDTCLAILEVLQRDLGDPKFRPCPLLRKYVEAGWLGEKAGRGFFTYG